MLRYIYMFFVGLFLAVFVGTGIAVFYESPKAPPEPAWFSRAEKSQISDTERQQEQVFNQQVRDYQAKLSVYNRNVSIIALIFAVLVLIVALMGADRLGVVADGLLMGGIFTLIYGIGRGMATDNNKYRFMVAAVGLAVTIGLGYFKFSKWRVKRA